MVMKDEKSHYVLSARWKTRKTSPSLKVQEWMGWGEEEREYWCKAWSLKAQNQMLWCPRAGEDEYPAQEESMQIHLSSAFCSTQALKELDDAHPYWWGLTIFTQSTDSNTNLFRNTSQTHLELMFYQLSGLS